MHVPPQWLILVSCHTSLLPFALCHGLQTLRHLALQELAVHGADSARMQAGITATGCALVDGGWPPQQSGCSYLHTSSKELKPVAKTSPASQAVVFALLPLYNRRALWKPWYPL